MSKPVHTESVYQYLAPLVDYNPETGEMFWRVRGGDDAAVKMFNTRFAGRQITRKGDSGYYHAGVRFNGKDLVVPVHRLAWYIVHGEVPQGQIDHKDRVRTNNRISNLRVVTHAENGRNQRLHSNNTSGYVGVSWDKNGRRWAAYVSHAGKRVGLGRYKDVSAAAEAAAAARQMLGISTGREAAQ